MAASPPSDRRPLRLRLGSESYGLGADRVVVGRSRSCDIRLREDTVSRLHSAFMWHAGALVLEDLGSSNGTYVNGERVLSPHVLSPGDVVRFGALRGAIESDDDAAAQADTLRPAEPLLDYTTGLLPGEPASFGWRLLAGATNAVLFALGSIVPFGPWLAMRFVEQRLLAPGVLPPGGQIKGLVAVGCSVLWLVYAWYYVVHGWAARGGTPGMRVWNLRLVDRKWTIPIGHRRAWLRLAAYFVTVLTLGIGFLAPIWRPDRKSLHDLLAGTMVIRRNRPLGPAGPIS